MEFSVLHYHCPAQYLSKRLMKTLFASFLAVGISTLAFSSLAFAQTDFHLGRYNEFVQDNSALRSGDLLRRYPIGSFESGVGAKLSDACYGKDIAKAYELTEGEKEKIRENGFMVSERLSYPSFGTPLVEIYKKDLPVFISTDAILHPLHISYDNILQEVETHLLIPRFQRLLEGMHVRLRGEMAAQTRMEMGAVLQDVDLYLTVARRLLMDEHNQPAPLYSENQSRVEQLLGMIEGKRPASYPLFVSEKSSPRDIDFSQFTPRGHYTSTPELTRYFKAMMWLGRTEVYLTPPRAFGLQGTKEDAQRQTMDALIIVYLLEQSGGMRIWKEADDLIRFMVGESDNVTPVAIRQLMSDAGITHPAQLLEDEPRKRFDKAFAAMPNKDQAIMSQLLGRHESDPEPVKSAVAFLLFGQRFIIDSYVLSNVVYDRTASLRMLPSPMDVLFALGNNSALPFLKSDLDMYSYAANLGGVRSLIDSYDSTFWNGTFYNGWLSLLRTLNLPSQAERKGLLRFMQTEAWWHQKMNTQLASWAEMRHDNILYAKQSYTTAYITCSYPKSFVEPIPQFFHGVASLSRRTSAKFPGLVTDMTEQYMQERIVAYFNNLANVCDTLASIAEKELRNEELSKQEIGFLRSMVHENRYMAGGGCGGGGGEERVSYTGWYPPLFYVPNDPKALLEQDYIVADIHTAPTDSDGNPVGWVMHVGTGPINMAVVTCESPDGSTCAYIGPVMSYYEHVTGGFDRLTDERWKEMQTAGGVPRPSWTGSYLVPR